MLNHADRLRRSLSNRQRELAATDDPVERYNIMQRAQRIERCLLKLEIRRNPRRMSSGDSSGDPAHAGE